MDNPSPTILVQSTLPALITVLHAETDPIRNALDTAVLAEAGMNRDDLAEMDPDKAVKLQKALADVDHLAVVTDYVKNNPEQAAKAIIPGIYLAGASFTAQDRVVDPVNEGIQAEVKG
jgi:predicted LPLAT superfamily acyltransferase